MAAHPKALVIVAVCGLGVIGASGCGVSQRYQIGGGSVLVGEDALIAGSYGAVDEADKAPLHPAVIEYLFARAELPIVGQAGDPAEVALAREIARTVAPTVNAALLASGIAKVMPMNVGGAESARKDFELLVSRRAKLALVRLYVNTDGNWSGVQFVGVDLAAVPEAFDPSATLTADDVARRGRFLEEPR